MVGRSNRKRGEAGKSTSPLQSKRKKRAFGLDLASLSPQEKLLMGIILVRTANRHR